MSQRQGLKQQHEATAFAGPRHRDLAGLAAGRAAHAWYAGMQPGLELEEVRVSPAARVAVMDGLIARAATRAGQPLLGAPDKKVDAMPGVVEIDRLDGPRRLQPEGHGEQRFDLHSHGQSLRDQPWARRCRAHKISHPVDLWTGPLARASRLSAKGAHLRMAGRTTLRVAHTPTHRPSAAHKLHRTPHHVGARNRFSLGMTKNPAVSMAGVSEITRA